VGEAFLRAILNERRRKPFASFEDFLERLSGYDLNKRQVEALIKAGAFDSLPNHRAQLLAVYETMIENLSAKSRANLAGQMDMFSMGDSLSEEAPAFQYPDVRPYTLREMLMLEKEASGMFFSGQLLDDYTRCVTALDPMPISRIVSSEEEEESALLPDRTKVRIAGIITGVTAKTTKREERMAFFEVEDAGGGIECLAFPKTFTQYGEIIKPDQAVFVEGNLSVREDESPKILVSTMGALVDNDHFSEDAKPKADPTPRAESAPPVREQKPTPGAQEPAAPLARAGERPQGAGGVYNPYEAMPPGPGYNPYEAMPAAVTPPRATAAGPAPRPPASPQKLYLRVPDRESEAYKKALNLCEIFCEGSSAGNGTAAGSGAAVAIFYDLSDGKYYASSLRVRATPFVLERLTRVLGEGNVVGK
jgi:hypothetical protein